MCFVNGLCVSHVFFLRVKYHTAVLLKSLALTSLASPGLCVLDKPEGAGAWAVQADRRSRAVHLAGQP